MSVHLVVLIMQVLIQLDCNSSKGLAHLWENR